MRTGDVRAHRYFSNALLWAWMFSIPFMLAGAFCPDVLLRWMGGDAQIVALGVSYARILLLFTPFFMCNYITSSFVRNDGDPCAGDGGYPQRQLVQCGV